MIIFILIIIFFEISHIFTVSNISLISNHEIERKKRAMLTSMSNIWSEREILYYVSPEIDHILVKMAVSRIKKETCFIFQRQMSLRESLFAYLPGTHYHTNLGKRLEIPHKIYIPPNSQHIGKIIRETMRALGAEYEHKRFDRNRYVVVTKDNAEFSFRRYFSKINSILTTTYGTEYDYRSIMHFAPYEYARSFGKVISAKDYLFQPFLGQSRYLTFNDAKILNKRYCSHPQIRHPQCLYYGYQHPRYPFMCKCLPFTSGQRCEIMTPNSPQCTQPSRYFATRRSSNVTLQVGGKCFYMFEVGPDKKMKIKIKFKFIRYPNSVKCTEDNSIEVKIKCNLSTSGLLFCPSMRELIFVSRCNFVAIVSSFPNSNIYINVEYLNFIE
ncbi:Astacin-like metalloendopeptidase [Strongyloides ratti]|uniref:Metalloendopeptidase n=1 Tax=Strongyloides ratti TaxID=34506 RepID=A0A090LM10_STRRB|nr:Astacin-like metalloendopeptidase [Strongyloides ratti]CEF68600.1 Astacin-like metalloendopeptidase [Strongyloides ratti]